MRHVIRYPQLVWPGLRASRRGRCRSACRILHSRKVIIRNLILTRHRSRLLDPAPALEHFVTQVVSHGRLAMRTNVRVLEHLHVIALLIGLQSLDLLVLG